MRELNNNITQDNPQIQWNSYQNTECTLLITRKNSSKICLETQNTTSNQVNLKKETQIWKYNTPNFISQTQSNKKSMVVAPKQTYQWNGLASPDITLCTYGKVIMTKEARIHNGERTISLTSGAGKTGQPLVKEWN